MFAFLVSILYLGCMCALYDCDPTNILPGMLRFLWWWYMIGGILGLMIHLGTAWHYMDKNEEKCIHYGFLFWADLTITVCFFLGVNVLQKSLIKTNVHYLVLFAFLVLLGVYFEILKQITRMHFAQNARLKSFEDKLTKKIKP